MRFFIQNLYCLEQAGSILTGFNKLLAAAVLSTSLIFPGSFAQANENTIPQVAATQAADTQVAVTKKTKKKKKRTARKSEPRSEGYAKAAEYMKRDVASTSEYKKKKSKKKSAKKKKSRKKTATT